jgi:hypothetical protein
MFAVAQFKGIQFYLIICFNNSIVDYLRHIVIYIRTININPYLAITILILSIRTS